MDYLQLLKNLKKEFFAANRAKYPSMNIVLRILFTLIFIPVRVSFFFARIYYWITWFFFKAIAVPVEYLEKWFEKQKENLGDISKGVLIYVALPWIFAYHVVLAFSSCIFFFQWFVLMLHAYVMTLGTVRWQPVIFEAKFDEE